MTALIAASRDALAKALFVAKGDALRSAQSLAELWDQAPDWSKRSEYRIADALFASGAVIDAATLADDEALVWKVAQSDYDMHAAEGARDFDDDWVTQAGQTLRALASTLAERQVQP